MILTLGITVKWGKIERSELNDWWRGRAIPASRSGIKTVLEDLQIATTQRLLEKCLDLSLFFKYALAVKDSLFQKDKKETDAKSASKERKV